MSYEELENFLEEWVGPQQNDYIADITNLDLSNSDLYVLPKVRVLNRFKNLKQLILNNNKITQIPENLHLPQLIRLRLENNLITQIPNLNLPRLRILRLGYNQITQIPENLNLSHLIMLALDNNPITQKHENLNILQRLLHFIHLS